MGSPTCRIRSPCCVCAASGLPAGVVAESAGSGNGRETDLRTRQRGRRAALNGSPSACAAMAARLVAPLETLLHIGSRLRSASFPGAVAAATYGP